jgi:hypothetical protein
VHVGDRDAAGWPDWVFVRDEDMVIVELKAEKGRLSLAQKIWLAELECVAAVSAGVRVFVWRPSSWPEIERVLGALRQGIREAA